MRHYPLICREHPDWPQSSPVSAWRVLLLPSIEPSLMPWLIAQVYLTMMEALDSQILCQALWAAKMIFLPLYPSTYWRQTDHKSKVSVTFGRVSQHLAVQQQYVHYSVVSPHSSPAIKDYVRLLRQRTYIWPPWYDFNDIFLPSCRC